MRCAHPTAPIIGRLLDSRGRTMVAYWCASCNGRLTPWLGHQAARAEVAKSGITLDDLPLMADNRHDDWPACERCGTADNTVEVHHWAPWSLFDDPNDWPTSTLCRACHIEWHQTTRCALAHGNPAQ